MQPATADAKSLRSTVRNSFYNSFVHLDADEGEYLPACRLLASTDSQSRCKTAIRLFLDIFHVLRICERKNVVHRNVTLDHLKYIQKEDAPQFCLADYDIARHAQHSSGDFYNEDGDAFYRNYDIAYAAEGSVRTDGNVYWIVTDVFTDLWSLGICFWEILTGKRFRQLIRKYIIRDDKDNISAEMMSKIYRLCDIKRKMMSYVDKLQLKESALVRNILDSIFNRRGANIEEAISAAHVAIGTCARLSICVSPLCTSDRASSIMSISSSSCRSEVSMRDAPPELHDIHTDGKMFTLNEEQKKIKEEIMYLLFVKCSGTFSFIKERYDFDSLITEIVYKFERPIAVAFALCAMVLDVIEGYYFDYEAVALLAARVHPTTTKENIKDAAEILVEDGMVARIME